MNTKCCQKCEGTKWPTEPCICSCHGSAKKLHSKFCSFRSNEAPCKCPTADTAEKNCCQRCWSTNTNRCAYPDCLCHSKDAGRDTSTTTDTSDWRERFDEFWVFGVDDVQRKANVKAFIEKELENQKENDAQIIQTLKDVIEGHKKMAPFFVEEGRADERGRLREVIEGMKKLPSPETQRTGIEVLPGADAVRVIYNAALSDLLSTLEGK